MPGTASTLRIADVPASNRAPRNAANGVARGNAVHIGPADRAFLLEIQRRAIEYFVQNQLPSGLVLDRQANHSHLRSEGLCSTAATGMGFIALALATAPPHQLLPKHAAVLRIRAALHAALHRLPHAHGILPHFIDSVTEKVHGADRLSTIDSSWFVAGALWAAEFLKDAQLDELARKLYGRIHWGYWATSDAEGRPALIRHGIGWNGLFLTPSWDRLNGETAFMYVLATGAERSKAIDDRAWRSLRPAYGTVAGLQFNNADLGLFVFQYGLDLLDLEQCKAPDGPDLAAEAQIATIANYRACRQASDRFVTYRRYWGVSAGDGPGGSPGQDIYRCYAPRSAMDSTAMDGTAHLTATAAAIAHASDEVLQNLHEARRDEKLHLLGRYGFSSVNVDRQWRARDMVGIDAGAAILAIDNVLTDNRVRTVFQSLDVVRTGLDRMGWTHSSPRSTSTPPAANLLAS